MLIDKVVFKTKLGVVLDLIEPGRLLDYGCWDQRYTQHLPESIGVDYSNIYDGVNGRPDYIMDSDRLLFCGGYFSNVTYLDTLEHIPDLEGTIREAHRVLKPKGVLVIVDPSDSVLFWTRLLCGRIGDALRGNPDHVHRFNKRKLVKLMKPLFELEKASYRGIFTGYKFRRVEIAE